ncbi:unnamed protein product, partial [Closterium sp. NIES-64]
MVALRASTRLNSFPPCIPTFPPLHPHLSPPASPPFPPCIPTFPPLHPHRSPPASPPFPPCIPTFPPLHPHLSPPASPPSPPPPPTFPPLHPHLSPPASPPFPPCIPTFPPLAFSPFPSLLPLLPPVSPTASPPFPNFSASPFPPVLPLLSPAESPPFLPSFPRFPPLLPLLSPTASPPFPPFASSPSPPCFPSFPRLHPLLSLPSLAYPPALLSASLLSPSLLATIPSEGDGDHNKQRKYRTCKTHCCNWGTGLVCHPSIRLPGTTEQRTLSFITRRLFLPVDVVGAWVDVECTDCTNNGSSTTGPKFYAAQSLPAGCLWNMDGASLDSESVTPRRQRLVRPPVPVLFVSVSFPSTPPISIRAHLFLSPLPYPHLQSLLSPSLSVPPQPLIAFHRLRKPYSILLYA